MARQLRDELAFGSRAFQRVERERGEARQRSRNDERGLRERSEREKGVHVPGVFGGEQRAEGKTPPLSFPSVASSNDVEPAKSVKQ